MENFVITIMDDERSVKVAERCIASGKKFNIDIRKCGASVPGQDLQTAWKRKKLGSISKFNDVYSVQSKAIACFLSHFMLWERSVETNQDITIFEHDAVVKSEIPEYVHHNGCISFGKPSYGKFNVPKFMGVNELTSKHYFPGAHAYRISPNGAIRLMLEAIRDPAPTDLFLNKARFPWLQEYYPWPVIADDSFTTIQMKKGCLAKHNYNKDYITL